MNKPFLLMVGNDYYPARGTGDWIGCYSSVEVAKSKIIISEDKWCPVKLNEPNSKYHNDEFNWYDIIDLRQWSENEYYR
jgi:hypothetical protein